MSDSAMTIEQRIARLEDIEAIRTLTNSYHTGINEHDLARICSPFAEDAVVVLSNGIRMEGLAAIRAGYEETMKGLKMVKQYIHSHTVEVVAESGTGASYLDARYVVKGDPTSYIVAAKLLYEYAKRKGRWQVTRYEVRMSFRVPLTVGWAGDKLMF
ncbi:MAG: nuclear transport factor 2 family protein [Betaproteobacteria bacterium]|nr:nuclear transport factor 2 family protein [Betaproteobacteria bacterium]